MLQCWFSSGNIRVREGILGAIKAWGITRSMNKAILHGASRQGEKAAASTWYAGASRYLSKRTLSVY